MEVHIPQDVYRKVMHWVNKSSNEVSGMGNVVWDAEAKTFTVVDAWLLKQVNGAAHTDIDAAALAKLSFAKKDVAGEFRWWWHSHVKMDVFWSSTDRETIKEFGQHGWMLATVFNQKEELRSALAYATESKSPFGDKVEVTLLDELKNFITYPTQLDAAPWDAEYAACVEEQKSGYLDYEDYQKKHGKNPVTILNQGKTVRPTEIELYTEGFWGFGLRSEAMALHMTSEQYALIIQYGTDKELEEIEMGLQLAMESGELKYDPTSRIEA